MIDQFIQKLINNPNFAGQPISLIELHICNFVEQNQQNLAPLLSGQLFPDLPVQEASSQLLNRIRVFIAEQVLADCQKILSRNIDFNILEEIHPEIAIPVEKRIENALLMFQKIISHREARQRIDALNILLEAGLIERYVTTSFEDKGYIFNELFRVEKHRMPPEHLIEYLKIAALLVPGYAVKLNLVELGPEPVNSFDLRQQPGRQDKFNQKTEAILATLFPHLSEDFWVTARNATYDITERADTDPGGKFLAIMFARAKDYRKNQKVEKGAETPDKSWFSIQVRNAAYMGFDKRMLEELNRLAFSLRM